MQIVIQTINGAYIVQENKQHELIQWLENNAVKAGPQTVKEQRALLSSDSTPSNSANDSKYLINETF